MIAFVDLLKASTEAAKLATLDCQVLSLDAAAIPVRATADAAQRLHDYCADLLAAKDDLAPQRPSPDDP
jgi:hypothetical protein